MQGGIGASRGMCFAFSSLPLPLHVNDLSCPAQARAERQLAQQEATAREATERSQQLAAQLAQVCWLPRWRNRRGLHRTASASNTGDASSRGGARAACCCVACLAHGSRADAGCGAAIAASTGVHAALPTARIRLPTIVACLLRVQEQHWRRVARQQQALARSAQESSNAAEAQLQSVQARGSNRS